MERLKTAIIIGQLAALLVAAFAFHGQLTDLRHLADLSGRCLDLSGALIESRSVCQQKLRQHDDVTRAVAAVGATPYRNPGNNCYDKSKALQKELARAGVESSIFVNETRGHAWVAVWVDAITGEFISPANTYGAVLEVRDRDLRVICSR